MQDSLDDWVSVLAAAPADRSLEGLEADVGRDIAARRREARTVKALAPLRIATVGLALVLGVAAGGLAATSAIQTERPAGPFAAVTELAPSTLLEGAG